MGARRAAVALVAVLLAASTVVLLAVSMAGDMPGGSMPVPGRAWPRLAFGVFMGGIAVVAAAAAASTAFPRARLRPMVVALIAIPTASVGARLLLIPAAAGAIPSALGILCLLAAVSLPAIAIATWRHPRAAPLAFVAALPAIAWLVAELVAVATVDTGLESALATVVREYLELSRFAAGILALWSAFALLRTARAAGDGLARSRVGVVPALLAVLAVKVTWAFAGYSGLIPGDILPDERAAWSASLDDGLVAWLAGALTLGVGAVLVSRARRRLDERGVRAGYWVIVAAFAVTGAAAGAIVLFLPIAQLLGHDPTDALQRTASVVGDLLLPIQLATILGLPFVALVLWRIRMRSVAVTLAIVAAWAVPSGIAVAWGIADPSLAAATPVHALLATPLTMDTLLTSLALLIWIRAARTGRWMVDPALLLVAVLMLGTVAHVGSLVPMALSMPVTAALLLYPVAWTLLVDAGPVNLPGPARPVRVVAVLAVSSLLLLLAMVPLAIGEVPEDGYAALARDLLLVPFGGALVLAWWGRRQRLPRLDARSRGGDLAREPIVDRLDRLGMPDRLGAGMVVALLALVGGWAYAQGISSGRSEVPPPMSSPTVAGSPMPATAIAPGSVVFGRALDLDAARIVGAAAEMPAGTTVSWLGRLAAPTSGTGLTLTVALDGVPLGTLDVPLEAGLEWVLGDAAFTLPASGVVTFSYREAGRTVAEGSVHVVDGP